MAAATVLVPVPRAVPLRPAEEAQLARLLDAASRLMPSLVAHPAAIVREADRTVYRRSILEALLALRCADGGALRANALARAMRLRAQPFANKARELVAMRAVERSESRAAGRAAVTYTLTPRGRRLGTLAFALTVFKSLQCRAALQPLSARPPAPADLALAPSAPGHAARAWEIIEREGDALARGFLDARPGPQGEGSAEVRRYAETCVRKWHGEVLLAVAQGPLRFGELRAALRVGDEALARALRSLTALGSLSRRADAYEITAWGRGDLALGAALTLAAVDARA